MSPTPRAMWLMPTSRGLRPSIWLISVIAWPPCWPQRCEPTIYVNPGSDFPAVQIAFARKEGVVFSGAGDHSPRRVVMDMITKLPEMSDDALTNLRTNARRLEQSGNPGQRSDAAALLPAVEAEIAARR